MTAPTIAQRSPFEIEVTEGKNYFWCACGLSKKQPLCDGSHKGTAFSPMKFTAAKTEKVWLCGCKHTKGHPFCDGTHSSL
jgi:CDGSH iron-sulfur domain-containing protein 3